MISLLTSEYFNADISSYIENHFKTIAGSFFVFLIGGFLKIFDADDLEEKYDLNNISNSVDGNVVLLLLQILFSLLFSSKRFEETTGTWILIFPTLLIIFREYFGTLLEIKKMLKNKD